MQYFQLSFKLIIIVIYVLEKSHTAKSQGASPATAGLQSLPCDLSQIFVGGKCFTACTGGYLNEHNSCVPYARPVCPVGYKFINGLCYQVDHPPAQICPDDYYLANNLCYRIVPLPCDGVTTSSPIIEPETEPEPVTEAITEPITEPITESVTEPTTEPITEPVTEPTTEQVTEPATEPITEPITEEPTTTPSPDAQIICPSDSIYTDGRCRKIYCTQGEYYRGRCLQPICPEGLVWRGHRCQPPNYVTTILEIDNVITHEAQSKPGLQFNNNINEVIYYSTSTNIPEMVPLPIIKSTTAKPIVRPKTTTTTQLPPATNQTLGPGCCSIVTPRICKRYGAKWVCFNRRYKRCDPELCQHPIIYLKVHGVVNEPPILIMPPNPPLQACAIEGCDMHNTVDCSGCAHNRREACSPYCYRYMCPYNGCSYVEQQEYCNRYPGEPGCTKDDGCIWDWCGEKCF